MTERPILFSPPMVKAILEERKSQTRRVMNPQPALGEHLYVYKGEPVGEIENEDSPILQMCKYGKVGDILWVRETWAKPTLVDGAENDFYYRADHIDKPKHVSKWKPSIYMPKEAARIWLQIEKLRVQRVQAITGSDAKCEGIEDGKHPALFRNYIDPNSDGFASSIHSFASLWWKINGEQSWNENPFVWVIHFKVLSTTGKPDTRSQWKKDFDRFLDYYEK